MSTGTNKDTQSQAPRGMVADTDNDMSGAKKKKILTSVRGTVKGKGLNSKGKQAGSQSLKNKNGFKSMHN